MNLWLVRRGDLVYIVTTQSKDMAISMARSFLLGDPDQYDVRRLTNPGDKLRINIGMRLDE